MDARRKRDLAEFHENSGIDGDNTGNICFLWGKMIELCYIHDLTVQLALAKFQSFADLLHLSLESRTLFFLRKT
jgi:hypothetical protein